MLALILYYVSLILIAFIIYLQIRVVKMITDFETKYLNPLDASKNLSTTERPTLIAYFAVIISVLFNISYLWPVLLLELASGISFYYYVADIYSWFEPRYLFRDLNKMKYRHSMLLLTNCLAGLIAILVLIFRK